MKKDLVKLSDLSRDDIFSILDLADQLKYDVKHGIPHRMLSGKVLAMIFEKNSTRTRAAFETGMFQLGGHAIYLTAADTQIERGEPIQDTARTLSRYCDAIMIRTYKQAEVEALAKYATVPVISGMTDDAHPCQVLAALMTMREKDPLLEHQKVCFVGDGNNICNSLIVGCLKCGMTVSVATPEGYEPSKEALDFAAAYGEKFTLCRDPREAVVGANIIYTDVWTSLGMEAETEARKKVFSGTYQVNHDLLALAAPNCHVQHCLPANRGQEITDEIFEAHADEIFDEAENRLHVQKAVLVTLLRAE